MKMKHHYSLLYKNHKTDYMSLTKSYNKYNQINHYNEYNQYGGKNKEYLIHDNGGRPFKCIIEDKHTIHIYKQSGYDEKLEEVLYEKTPVLTFHPKKIFIGKSPLNEMTEFSGGHGPDFDGNSLLLEMNDLEYIYVGSETWSFDAKHKIKEYVSPVGNNDVPYPFAIDNSNNIYLMLDKVILKYNPDIFEKIKEDPYDFYYENNLITADMGTIPPQKSKMNMNIKEFYAGNKQFTMRYKPSTTAGKEYNRLKKEFGDIYIVDDNDKKIDLTKKDYINLMKDIEKQQSFESFSVKKHYLGRDIGGSFLGFYIGAVAQAKESMNSTDDEKSD